MALLRIGKLSQTFVFVCIAFSSYNLRKPLKLHSEKWEISDLGFQSNLTFVGDHVNNDVNYNSLDDIISLQSWVLRSCDKIV